MDDNRRALSRKKVKELKKELNGIKKRLSKLGCNKKYLRQWIKDFLETLQLGVAEQVAYKEAASHVREAGEQIAPLLAGMETQSPDELYENLSVLARHLDCVYHDCLIRVDDLDFKSTISNLKQMIKLVAKAGSGDKKGGKKFGGRKKDMHENAAALQGAVEAGMSDIMLRSELENIKAVLDDTEKWNAPDYFALAYYILHGDKETLKEMENEQRNTYLADYCKEHFTNLFYAECDRVNACNITEKTAELIKRYL